MADIKINDLTITGAGLFLDSETFLNDLGDDEMNIQGGRWSTASDACCTVREDEWSTWSDGCGKETCPGWTPF